MVIEAHGLFWVFVKEAVIPAESGGQVKITDSLPTFAASRPGDGPYWSSQFVEAVAA